MQRRERGAGELKDRGRGRERGVGGKGEEEEGGRETAQLLPDGVQQNMSVLISFVGFFAEYFSSYLVPYYRNVMRLLSKHTNSSSSLNKSIFQHRTKKPHASLLLLSVMLLWLYLQNMNTYEALQFFVFSAHRLPSPPDRNCDDPLPIPSRTCVHFSTCSRSV